MTAPETRQATDEPDESASSSYSMLYSRWETAIAENESLRARIRQLEAEGMERHAFEIRYEQAIEAEEELRAAAQERDRQIAVLEQERDDDTATIKRLNATVTAQAEALKSLEWCMPSYSEGGIDRGRGCPSCGGHEYGTGYAQHEPGGHRDKCRLAAVLKPESKE